MVEVKCASNTAEDKMEIISLGIILAKWVKVL